jgi:nicotinamidase-related amidase
MNKIKSKHPIPSGGKTALLVIDVQQALFERPIPVYKGEEFLHNVNTLIDRARKAGVPVIFIQHSNDTLLVKDTPGWQLHPQIQPKAGEPIIRKLEGNAFAKTNLVEVLRERQASHLVICGLVTHGCVKNTCLGALELGYRVTLVKDGHSNMSEEAPRLIEEWNKKLGDMGAVLKTAVEVSF